MLYRSIFVIFTLLFSTSLFAATVTTSGAGNPDTDGSYTINWSPGVRESGPYKLLENGAQIYSGNGVSRSISGKSSGTYTYTVRGLVTTIGTPWEPGETTERNIGSVVVTVDMSPSVPATPTGPSSSSGADYSISWTKPAGTVTSYDLRRKLGSGSYSTIYSGSSLTLSESASEGTWSYQVRACNGTSCSAYSGTKVVTVEYPGSSESPTPPATNNGSVITLTWATPTSNGYLITESPGGRSWERTGSVTSTVINAPADGSYTYTLANCFVFNEGGGAQDEFRCGNPGSPGSSVTVRNKPGVVAAPIAADTTITSSSAVLTWTAPTGTATKYYIEKESNNSGTWTQVDGSQTGLSKTVTGLTEGLWKFRILACNEFDWSCSTGSESVDVEYRAIPSVPSAPTGPATSTGSAAVSWTEPAGNVTYYDVQKRLNNTGSWLTGVDGETTTSNTLSGLTDGTWDFRVRACNENSWACSAYSAASADSLVRLKPSTPAAPTLPASDVDGSYSVDWVKPSGTVTYYDLQERTNNAGTWSTIASATSALTEALTGRADNTYDYQVRACNEYSWACSSYSSASTDIVVLELPGTPSSITVPTSDTDGTVTINWGTSTGQVDDYRLEEQKDSGAWVEVQSGATNTSTVLTGRGSGSFNYQVRACNDSGCSNYRVGSNSLEVLLKPSAPATPTGPSSSAGEDYTISWVKPSGTVTSYDLQRKLDSGAYSVIYSGTSLSQVESGQGEGDWSYQVRACNDSGCSNYSGTKVVTLNYPDTSESPNPPATNDGSVITLTWATATSNGYRITESPGGRSWERTGNVTSTVINAPADGTYTYTLANCFVFNEGGGAQDEFNCGNDGPSGSSVTVRHRPEVPAAPTLPANDADGSYTVSWLKPSGTVTYYDLQERTNNLGAWNIIANSTALLSETVNGRAEETYDYQVRACNEFEWSCSNFSAVSQDVVVLALPSVPGSVTYPTLDSDGEVIISWAASTGQVDQYILEQQEGTNGWTEVDGNLTVTTKTINGLTDGNFSFRVAACNVSGCSEYRTGTNSLDVYITPSIPLSPTAPSSSSDGVFSVSWTALEGNVTSYELQRKFGSGIFTSVYTGSDLFFEETGLDEGVWSYQLRACNHSSCSLYSEVTTVNVANTAPVIVEGEAFDFELNENSAGSFTLNVTDAENDTITWSIAAQGNLGSAVADGTGPAKSISYTPNPDTTGTDTFVVEVSDGLLTDSITITVNIVVQNIEAQDWAEKSSVLIPDAATSTYSPSTNEAIGAVEGKAGVSGGAASYNIPIALPPGRAGMQPSVSLNYSSRSGNGIAGVGWGLSAGGSVSRCGATAAQDGFTAAVQYDAVRDRLCLDGQRLIAVSGVYGQAGTEYRTEMDSFAKITQSGSINGTATSFEVEYKNGMISKFGINAESRVTASGRNETLTWLLADSQDRSGNTISYEYDNQGDGEFLLSAIHYTGYQGSDGDRHVRFEYEDRPDKNTSYLVGGKTRSTQRLSKISTEYLLTVVREYTLDYGDVSLASSRSLLRSVEECASGVCLPATTFEWQENTQQFSLEKLQYQEEGAQTVIHSDKRWLHEILPHGDVNGDGVKDWTDIHVNAEGEKTGEHDNQLANCYSPRVAFTLICLDADVNADGISDNFRRNSTTETFEYKLSGSEIWKDSGIEWQYRISGVTTQDDRPIGFADYNGDGWTDLAFKVDRGLYIYYHSKSLTSPYNASDRQKIFTYKYSDDGLLPKLEAELIGDIDGNGIPDFVVQGHSPIIPHPKPNSFILVHSETNGSVSTTTRNLSVSNNSIFIFGEMFADINGDGLVDILTLDNLDLTLKYRLNDGTDFIEGWVDLNIYFPYSEGIIQRPGKETESTYFPSMSKVLMMDYDGDGRQEILYAGQILASGCQGLLSDTNLKCDNDLYGYTEVSPSTSSFSSINSSIRDDSVRRYTAIRFDEDDNGNIITTKFATEIIASASQAAAIDATGNGLPDVVTAFGCRIGHHCSFNTDTNRVQNPAYEEGAWINRNLGSTDGSSRYEPQDMLKSVTNGLGVESEWVHRPLSSDEYNTDNSDYYSTDHAYQDGDHFHFASSMYAVASFKQSNGIGGKNETLYRYEGAMYNNKGRGFQGFRQMVVENVELGTHSMTEFHQKFPLAGKIESARTCLITDSYDTCLNTPLSRTEVEYQDFRTVHAKSIWVVPKNTVEENFDLVNRSARLNQKETIIDLVGIDVYYGIIANTETTVDNGFSKVKVTTSNEFYPADESDWWINKLESVTVTSETITGSSVHDPDLDPIKEIKTSYAYHSPSRQPDVVTVTPVRGGGFITSVDTDYNLYGLPTKVTTTGDGQSRSVESTYSNNGEIEAEDGYFVYKVTNDLDQEVITKTYPEHGQVKSVTDVNDLVSSTTYDVFGRVEKVTPPTGTGQPAYSWFSSCNSGCDDVTSVYPSDIDDTLVSDVASLVAYKVTTGSVGAPETTLYKDKFNRVLFAKTQGFDGSSIFIRTEYDALGRKVFESVPSFSVDEDKGVHYKAFDELNRVTSKVTDQPNNKSFEVTYGYVGHQTSVQALGSDGKLLDMSRTHSGTGQLMKTTDDDNGVTEYAYDSQGNPIVLQDANGNPIKAEYNALGQKKFVDDPNMGIKTFAYTGFGEIYSETDANDDTYYYAYDVLGRLEYRYLNRVPTEENTLFAEAYFSYDSGDKGVVGTCEGLPHQEIRQDLSASEEYERTYAYDSYCRPLSSVTNIDGTDYVQSTQYDAFFGRVKGVTTVSGVTVENLYNGYGYQTHSKNAANDYVYQQITDMDARLQMTTTRKANGILDEVFDYSDVTGQMFSVHTDTVAGNQRHRIDYTYDDFGNLKLQTIENMDRNTDSVIVSTETYDYDGLHRLLTATRDIGGTSDVTNYLYDAVGNFTKKDDYVAGDNGFSYGNLGKTAGGLAGPNAVRSINKAGGGTITYAYDANGNQISSTGSDNSDNKTVIYNAFNKPVSITKGEITSLFSYGANQMRYKQIKQGQTGGDETTIYIDKSYEEITYNGVTTKRQYIGDAIINETVGGNDAGSKIGFVHRDRLNSVVTITDHNGNVVDNKSFDAFGKPRSGSMASISPATLRDVASSGLYELQTNRGFTDHEHLDDAELIHMNGRVYDYNLGRFLSVDPFIQFTGNSQSINPYSYIMNNPLAGTDPSGYLVFLIPAIVKGGGALLALYGAYETGDAIGTGIYDVASGKKSPGDAALDTGKQIVVDKAMAYTGAKIYKAIPDSLTKPVVDKIEKALGNGNDASVKSDGDTSSIGNEASKNKLEVGKVDSYSDAKKTTGDGTVDRDHQPSKGAGKMRAEELKGSPLTPKEATKVENAMQTMNVPKDVHVAGPTYGSKNTVEQMRTDSGNMAQAASRDADAAVSNAQSLGHSEATVNKLKQGAEKIKSTTNEQHDKILKSCLDSSCK